MTHIISKQTVWQLALRVFSIGLLPALTAYPAFGAERIKFNYGVLERSIPISSLETYARTGKMDEDLAVYSQYIDKKQLTQLRQTLLTPIKLNQIGVSQFLYTPIGEQLLETLGKVIQTESRLSGFYAIRAALILAAADSQNFTLLNVLQKFPASSISINLNQTLEIVNSLQNLANQTQNAVAIINQQAQQKTTTASTLNPVLLRDLGQNGSFRFSKQTIVLNDLTRQRNFPADIYLPIAQTPRSIIVISHGLGSDRTSFAYLAEHLASYGLGISLLMVL